MQIFANFNAPVLEEERRSTPTPKMPKMRDQKNKFPSKRSNIGSYVFHYVPLRFNYFGVNGIILASVSGFFGYGLMDAHQLVQKARVWKPVPERTACSVIINPTDARSGWEVSPDTPTRITFNVTDLSCENGDALPDRLEHVQLTINTNNMWQYTLFSASLISPSGTKSVILGFR